MAANRPVADIAIGKNTTERSIVLRCPDCKIELSDETDVCDCDQQVGAPRGSTLGTNIRMFTLVLVAGFGSGTYATSLGPAYESAFIGIWFLVFFIWGVCFKFAYNLKGYWLVFTFILSMIPTVLVYEYIREEREGLHIPSQGVTAHPAPTSTPSGRGGGI